MAQFDVFASPVASARRAWPLVVELQSNYAHDARDPIIAPMVPALGGVNRRSLSLAEGSIAAARNELLAAVDYLFFGL